MKKLTRKQVKRNLENIKATMAFENMKLRNKEINMCKRILEGKYTGDEARQQVLKGYLGK